MRAVVVLICLCGLARAEPHTPSTSTNPAMVAAERAWTVAAAARGPAASDLWEDAAVAFVAIAEARTLPEADLAHAARAALAALRTSIATEGHARTKPPSKFDPDLDRPPVPQELASRDKRMIRVLAVAERYESPDARAKLAFMRANVWRDYDHLDKAVAIYLEIIANYPTHELAEAAANGALDSYNLLHRYTDLLALVEKLRADKKFLAKRPVLANTVVKLYAQGQRLVALEASELARKTGDRAYYEKCAEAFLAALDGVSRRSNDDEILHNALVCFDEAGAFDRALEILRRLLADFPSSSLTHRAERRMLDRLALIGRFDEAATAAERWMRTNFFEPETTELLDDTIRWRAAASGLDAARRVLDAHLARVKKTPRDFDRSELTALLLAEQYLERARTEPPSAAALSRAVAVRLVARGPDPHRPTDTNAASRIHFARIIATAACPILLVDELCARPRDARLMAIARRELAGVPRPDDAVTLFLADLALEAILAKRAPTANLDADYRHLASSADSVVRVAALARLSAFAKHANDATRQARYLEECIAEAHATTSAEVLTTSETHATTSAEGSDPWLLICERELAVLESRLSRTSGRRARDVLPSPTAPVPLAIEGPLTKPLVRLRRESNKLSVFEESDDVIAP